MVNRRVMKHIILIERKVVLYKDYSVRAELIKSLVGKKSNSIFDGSPTYFERQNEVRVNSSSGMIEEVHASIMEVLVKNHSYFTPERVCVNGTDYFKYTISLGELGYKAYYIDGIFMGYYGAPDNGMPVLENVSIEHPLIVSEKFGNEFNGGYTYHVPSSWEDYSLGDGFKVIYESPGYIDGYGCGDKGGVYIVKE